MKYSDGFKSIDLEKWDGTCPGRDDVYKHHDDLLTDKAGNIYYISASSGFACLWCGADELGRHLHHLAQIFAR